MAASFSPRRAVLALAVLLAAGALSAADPPERSSPPREISPRPADISPAPDDATGSVPAAEMQVYRLLKRFDFAERELGNYEETPMHWARFAGPGLPPYSRGRFDMTVGHDAPPSFRLSLTGGNVGYEYQKADIPILRGSDYVIVGQIRAEGLRNSRAFLAAHLVDRFGETLAGTDRVSELVGATGQKWQQVQIALSGEHPDAFAVRLQAWILQSYVWQPVASDAIDPIIRQDVHASAWFDDIEVYRLPRARLRLTNEAGLVRPGARESVVLEVNNATNRPLSARLSIRDAAGTEVHGALLTAPSNADPAPYFQAPQPRDSQAAQHSPEESRITPGRVQHALPVLPVGLYTARVTLLAGPEGLLERELRFAVLPELPPRGLATAEIGVDLGRWPGGDAAATRELVTTLGAGAVKIGVPMLGGTTNSEQAEYFNAIADLLRELAEHRVDSTGVILSESAAAGERRVLSTLDILRQDENWRGIFNPVLANLGGLVSSWQLGAEQNELKGGAVWTPTFVERVREQLARFVTVPELVVPRSVFDAGDDGRDAVSYWLPGSVAAASFPWTLQFLARNSAAARWLMLDWDASGNLRADLRIADMARRLVLAKTLEPDRVYFPAPFEPSPAGAEGQWQPRDEFIPLRTLVQMLSGAKALGVLRPREDVLGVIWERGGMGILVIWTWCERPSEKPVELYLGPGAQAIDLWGRRQPLDVHEDRTAILLTPTPLILYSIDAPLALLQSSFRVDPRYVQPHDPRPQPVVSFRSAYTEPMTGTLHFEPPREWKLGPRDVEFSLGPGEELSQLLDLDLPPRQLAADQPLGVRISVQSPQQHELKFHVPLSVGLRDIFVDAIAYWQDDTLLVEQSIRNQTEVAVSFAGFCQAPARARLEWEFLDIRAGETSRHLYVFPNARELAGLSVHLGVEEIRGERTLDQLVEVPR